MKEPNGRPFTTGKQAPLTLKNCDQNQDAHRKQNGRRASHLEAVQVLIRVQGRDVRVTEPGTIDVQAGQGALVHVGTSVYGTADALCANLRGIERDGLRNASCRGLRKSLRRLVFSFSADVAE